MAAPFTPNTDRLAKLCGLLGSSFDGERATAALMATAELKRAGLTWEALIRRACAPVPTITPTMQQAPADDRMMLSAVRARLSLLSDWEIGFTETLLAWRGRITPKQRLVLRRIYERVAAGGAA